ncbi:MAG: hypothetical protein HC896_00065 [Bacteroidales bacterium]|nr:hypothetical protein [Bacteroidales bacterium]
MFEIKFWIAGISVFVLFAAVTFLVKVMIKMLLDKLREIADDLKKIVENITKIITQHQALEKRVTDLEITVKEIKETQDRCANCNL